jgi:type II restriction/modification system DNA methylase subunit YeeA
LSDQKLRCEKAIEEMLRLEAGNNSILIDGFGLNGALSPDVACEQVVLSKAEAGTEIGAFISYAVGCMMGRYSLDQPGLVLADVGDTLEQYLEKVGKSKDALQFQPDDDGILPVMDVEWFEDDIVSRFEAFLIATFGKDKLTENIQFIEKSLGTDIRSYFLGGFYKDHLQTYKKRPIYWMAQSPKKAFCALIYLHRYTKDTLSLLLNSYLRPYILKLNSRIEILAQTEASAGSAREKTAARKELEKLRKYVRECEQWERDVLLPAAQSRIELDLDDGVKVNYLKLGDVLTPIPGLAAKEDE